ncbi:MAG: SURF1 family protein [Marmoricola sp.]
MRFLLSRRWVMFAVTVALLGWLAVRLGEWQFHRLDERKHSNAVVSRNLDAEPVPLADVMSTEKAPGADDEWRRVRVTGTWDDERTIVLKYQTRDQSAGIELVTPLVTGSGAGVLVDRGWVLASNNVVRPELPAATSGEVTVTGWVRRDATGDATRISEMATRAISSRTAAAEVSYPLYRGFIDLDEQDPAAATKLQAAELPDHTGNGPHFFYGLQWWFFGALAVFGFFYLAFDEWRQKRRPKRVVQASAHPEQ